METTIPEKKIHVCDFCHDRRESYLQTCIVCGKEFCLICEGKAHNPYHLQFCQDCIELPEVEAMNEEAGKEWRKGHDKLLEAIIARKIEPRPYCPKCKRKVAEISPNQYECSHCNITVTRKSKL
jgi:hypothetical protein